MAFQLKSSNSLERLAEGFCQDLQSARVDVFSPHIIVTQTAGMNNWLNIQIAERLGIAANCRYLKPNDLIYRIYFLLGGKASQTLSIQNMTWLLFQLLGTEQFTIKFPEIARYYNGANADAETESGIREKQINAVKRLALARKVADLFDQYQVYRADMMANWNSAEADDLDRAGLSPKLGNLADWQLYLWQRARGVAGERFPDKIKVAGEIEQALQDPDKVAYLQSKMGAIYFFGISLLTNFHLKIFQQLSDYIHLYLYLLNPAPSDYWFDDLSEKKLRFLQKIGKADAAERSTGNPLLLSWGKIIQDTFSMLFQNDEVIAGYEELYSEEPPADTLLHSIQQAIYLNRPKEDMENTANGQYDSLLNDGSITINACYSPIREVEVLYNYLVHLIDRQNQRLAPRDIVVMVSDIDLYAAYIKAVFEHAPYAFPYKIADERFVYSDSISSALASILELNADNFTSESVIRLLDSSYIRTRLQIQDLPLIRSVVEAANIRFGMEGQLSDDTIYVSWVYGLKRIMYGICISGGEELGTGPESFFPVDLVEGGAAQDVIRFVHFAEQLMESIRERQKDRCLDGWSQYIEEVLSNFICDEQDVTDEDYQSILSQLDDYNTTKTIYESAVSFHVFLESFQEGIAGAARSHSFGTGGVTFCSLIPMRSIPFKVVALLGLDFDKFPRKDHPLGFDLMEKEKRKGDRNVKENDKHLFLETLLSAKQYLYISYIGQNIKDNSPIPPATLVDELVGYIAANSSDPEKVNADFITRQPLHGFNRQYFNQNNPKLYTYLVQSPGTRVPVKRDQQQTTAASQAADTNPDSEVSLTQLIRFFKNPIQGYYEQVLGIYYPQSNAALRETELFELNALQKWTLRGQLLPVQDDTQRDALRDQLVKTGQLPLKNMALLTMESAEEVVDPVRRLWLQLVAGQPERSIAIDLQLGEVQLKGTVDGIYGEKMIQVSWSKNEQKYLLATYIQYLAIRAMDKPVVACFISKEKLKVTYAADIEPASAREELMSLLQLFKEGHLHPLLFMADWKLFKIPEDIEKVDIANWERIINTMLDDNHKRVDQYHQSAHALGLFHRRDAVDQYKMLAKRILGPMVKYFSDFYA